MGTFNAQIMKMHREKLDNMNRMKQNPVTVEVLGKFTNLNRPSLNVDKKSEYTYPDTMRSKEQPEKSDTISKEIAPPEINLNSNMITSK